MARPADRTKLGPVGLPARPITFQDFERGGTPTSAANFNSMQDGLIELIDQMIGESQSSPTSLVTAERELQYGETVFADATAGSFNLKLPPAAANERSIRVVLISAGAHTVTVIPHAGEKIRVKGVLETNVVLSVEATLFNSIEVASDGSNPNVLA